jgi:hypothetical protein
MLEFHPVSFAAGFVVGPIFFYLALQLLGWLIAKVPGFIER